MLTQIQDFSTTNLDELALSLAEFNKLMDDGDVFSHPMGAIYTSTVQILRYAFWLGKQKAVLTKQQFRELLNKIGWKREAKRYLDVDKAFGGFLPDQLAQIEAHTIFRIAGNLKKYQSVITRIATLAQITQDAVRGFMQQCRKPRPTKTEEEPSIWRMAPDGKRVFQAPPIYDEVTGIIIQEIMEAEGRSAQSILAEAVLALKEKREGRLVYTQQVSDLENIETNLFTEEQESEEFTVQDLQPSSDLTTNYTEAPAVTDELETRNEFLIENCDQEPSKYLEFDDIYLHSNSRSVVKAPVDEIWYNDEDLDIQDSWIELEPEKDDEIEDYEFLDSRYAQEEKTPVEKLIEKYRTATCWEEINPLVTLYSEFELQAWNALTPLERRRVIEMMAVT
jgi:hypothetical protein